MYLLHHMSLYTEWPQKTSRTFACIMQWSSQDKSAEKHLCYEQSSLNMFRNFRLKRFRISTDTNKISVAHHKADYANGSSSTLLVVCRLHHNVTEDLIFSHFISQNVL